jgi:hypothetical protein
MKFKAKRFGDIKNFRDFVFEPVERETRHMKIGNTAIKCDGSYPGERRFVASGTTVWVRVDNQSPWG